MLNKTSYLQGKMFSYQGLTSIGVSMVLVIAGLTASISALANIMLGLVTFLLTFIATELFEYTTFLADHRAHVLTLDKFFDAGFEEYFPEFTEINFKEEFRHSNSLKIISIYSSGIFTSNYDAFKRFLSQPNRRLEVVLLKPDQGLEAHRYLRRRFGHNDPNQLQNSIQTFKDELMRLKADLQRDFPQGHGEIKLYYSEMIPQYSLLLFDNVAYVTLYKNAKGRSTRVPAFKIRNGSTASMFAFVSTDYAELIGDGAYVIEEAL